VEGRRVGWRSRYEFPEKKNGFKDGRTKFFKKSEIKKKRRRKKKTTDQLN